MKAWLLQKVNDYTSRKFAFCVLAEIMGWTLIHQKMVQNEWAQIAMVLGPLALYYIFNYLDTTNSLKIQAGGATVELTGTDKPNE